MLLWLGVFALAFVAEVASEALGTFHYGALRSLAPHRTARWAVLLLGLGWADLGGVAAGWPLSALLAGSLSGGYVGTWWSVKRMQV